ncbi:MAG: hypothetical protein NTY19_26600 [Planctomycetota bacterium]|nr:hypothetical protein [Planctomycetota bacterium]
MRRSGTALRDLVTRKLDDPDNYVRAAAIGALLPHRTHQASVLALVCHRDWRTRRDTATALAENLLVDPSLTPSIVQVVHDLQCLEASPSRAAAIGALSGLLAEQAPLREAVERKLGDEHFVVRAAAVRALSAFVSSPNLRDLLVPALAMDDGEASMWDYSPRSSPRKTLVEHWGRWVAQDAAGRDKVIEMLRSADCRLRQSAAEILAAAGKDAVLQGASQLVNAMDDHRGYDSWPARIAAAELLINHPQHSRLCVDTILPALDYGTHPLVIVPMAAEIRKAAALAFGKLKADEYRVEVADKLKSLLGTERDPQVLNALFHALESLAAASLW